MFRRVSAFLCNFLLARCQKKVDHRGSGSSCFLFEKESSKENLRLWKKRLAPKFAKRVGGKQFLGLCIPRTCTSVPRFPPSVRANPGASSAFFPRPRRQRLNKESLKEEIINHFKCVRAETRSHRIRRMENMTGGIPGNARPRRT